MWLTLYLLFGILNLHNSDSINKYVKDSHGMADIFSYMEYVSDVEPEDEFAGLSRITKFYGGDCDDFAVAVYELLTPEGYIVKLYILESVEEPVTHCIATFEKGKDKGYVSNQYVHFVDEIDLDAICEQYEYELWNEYEYKTQEWK